MSPNMNVPLVSIITTCYNAEKLIRQAVEGILSQTYTNIEYIIIDDGSSDRTANIIEGMRDSRIHFIKAGRIGRGRALNLGLAMAKGEYIAIQDADDVSHPERLEIQMNIMQNRRDDIVLGTAAKRISGEQCIDVHALASIDTTKIHVDDVTQHINYYNPIKHSSMVMTRESLLKIGGYSEIRKNLFDWDMLIRYVASGGRLCTISTPLIFKRQHKTQFFECKNRILYVLSSIHLQYRMVRYLDKSRLVLLLLPILMAYRLLPLRVRMFLRDFIGR